MVPVEPELGEVAPHMLVAPDMPHAHLGAAKKEVERFGRVYMGAIRAADGEARRTRKRKEKA
jgi:hypothetical protein